MSSEVSSHFYFLTQYYCRFFNINNSIDNPCEGELHARFDEGRADCFYLYLLK